MKQTKKSHVYNRNEGRNFHLIRLIQNRRERPRWINPFIFFAYRNLTERIKVELRQRKEKLKENKKNWPCPCPVGPSPPLQASNSKLLTKEI